MKLSFAFLLAVSTFHSWTYLSCSDNNLSQSPSNSLAVVTLPPQHSKPIAIPRKNPGSPEKNMFSVGSPQAALPAAFRRMIKATHNR